ncbi:DUF1911 domain-containing protein [Lacinutrix neustonica]|uniref:DUF1911 domain-containing protein n=1 Tax=Lacinutrix neustonica TaxID=2980107 RepID=A0A9E8MUP4_9FLAO|nr:PoNe immunity protein domain-containing protein [Lacinutrix neustonica]WAC01888.1 DUF1911 domain-containing protein [Lacinutrix neustonica]
MRDTLKNKEYFDEFIDILYQRIEKRISKINNSEIKLERIDIVKGSMSYGFLSILRAKYSRGDEMFSEDVRRDCENAITLMYEASNSKSQNILHYIEEKEVKYLKQYTLQFHIDMIDMLSFGVLLNISIDCFQLIMNKIDKDGIKDFLYEFLIQSRITNRKKIEKENFQEFSWYRDRFKKLKDIINIDDKNTAQTMLKSFLETSWYDSLKDSNLYNQHMRVGGNYLGYYCYIAAAIVKIKNLDDSSFRDNRYYPKDLIKF